MARLKDPGCCDEDSHAPECENACEKHWRDEDGDVHLCDRTKGHALKGASGGHRQGNESWSATGWASHAKQLQKSGEKVPRVHTLRT